MTNSRAPESSRRFGCARRHQRVQAGIVTASCGSMPSPVESFIMLEAVFVRPKQSVLKLTVLILAGALWLQGFCAARVPADAPSDSSASDSGCHRHQHPASPSPASPVQAQSCCGLVPAFRPSPVTIPSAQLPVMIARIAEGDSTSLLPTPASAESEQVLPPPARPILRI
jgi:hypothetical protein